MAIKVMLVDDEAGVRLLLRKIIEKNSEFEVVCECDNFTEAVSLFAKNRPEVVFLDIEIVGASGLDFARIISDIEPKTKVIFATAFLIPSFSSRTPTAVAPFKVYPVRVYSPFSSSSSRYLSQSVYQNPGIS